MGALNFKEIPMANKADGKQDSFELFCREFIEIILHFKVKEGPDRGQDGGRDIIAVEKQKGTLTSSEKRWLISCKHRIHSGASVSEADEQNIVDRINAHKCNGFIGFYSTVISSPLSRRLKGIQENNNLEIAILDNERIERELLNCGEGINLIQRFFPESYKQICAPKDTKTDLLSDYSPLLCDVCGKELLDKNYSGIIAMEQSRNNEDGKKTIHSIYWACKGECDKSLERLAYKERGNITGWNDISDLLIPRCYIKWIMAILNGIHVHGDIYTDEAFDKLKEFIVCISQLTLRNHSEKENERFGKLMMIPDYL
ncbi:hypothetical protein KA977_14020 [Candidatus Dependentiae bacterium]|nr:hypothetical protein [Candidatus Dependentiae bacterium]